MYQELHRWEDAIAVAEARVKISSKNSLDSSPQLYFFNCQNHPDLANLRSSYFQWLQESGQEEVAGQVREREGDLHGAIALYMKAGLPAKAARLVTQHEQLSRQPDLLQQIASSLVKAGLYEKAGDLYEQAHSYQQAMDAFRSGAVFRRAVELARSSFPSEVVRLEEQWGDHLCTQKQFASAITHFIEAG